MHKRCGSLKILQPALTWVVILHCVVKTWKMRMDILWIVLCMQHSGYKNQIMY